MELKERLRRAASLFVEMPEEAPQRSAQSLQTTDDTEEDVQEPTPRPSRTIEEMVRETEGPDLDAITLGDTPHFEAAPVPTGDFASIYAQASLPEPQFTAEQAVDMLRSLPPELPLAMKRQTMAVMLNSMGKALGATPETIVADASRKLAALAAYGDSVSEQTTATLAQKNQEIADLQTMIEAKRGEIATAQDNLAQVLKSCHDEADRIDDVLEFFSLDVPPSRHSDAA